MESTIALCKSELIDFEAGTWTDWGEVERATVGWVHRYNHERLHSSLGHIPPIERYTNYQRENYAGLHAALKNSGRFTGKWLLPWVYSEILLADFYHPWEALMLSGIAMTATPS